MSKLMVVASIPVVHAGLNVLVFGDSFGDTGPTYKVVQDMFDMHGIDATVRSSAIGGTASCQWAAEDDGMQMVLQTQKLFPNATEGPDYVWFTMGANDQWQDHTFQGCLKNSTNDDDALACTSGVSDRILACSTKMLDNFWKAYPKSKVLQTGYEIPCESVLCDDTFNALFYKKYCGNNAKCSNTLGFNFQNMHVASMGEYYKTQPYTSISIIGAAQKAAGVQGADVGKPNFDEGAKCEWTAFCCHPKYGTPAGDAWRDAFWDLYFSKEFAAIV